MTKKLKRVGSFLVAAGLMLTCVFQGVPAKALGQTTYISDVEFSIKDGVPTVSATTTMKHINAQPIFYIVLNKDEMKSNDVETDDIVGNATIDGRNMQLMLTKNGGSFDKVAYGQLSSAAQDSDQQKIPNDYTVLEGETGEYYMVVWSLNGTSDSNVTLFELTNGNYTKPMTAPTVAVAQATGTDSGLDFTITAGADFAQVGSYTVNVYENSATDAKATPVATVSKNVTLDDGTDETVVNVPLDVDAAPKYDGATADYKYIVTANAKSDATKGAVSTALTVAGVTPAKITLSNLSAATLTVTPGPTTITLTTEGDYEKLPTGTELQHSVVAKGDPVGAYTTGEITGLTMDKDYDVYAKVVAKTGNDKYYIDSTAQKFAAKTTKGAEVTVIGTPKDIVVVKDTAGDQEYISDAMIAAAFADVKVVVKADESKVLDGEWKANTVSLDQGKNASVVFTWTAAENAGGPYSTATAKTTVYVKKAVTAGDFTATGTLSKTYDGTSALPTGTTLTLGTKTIGSNALVLNNTAGNTFTGTYKDEKVANNKDIVISSIAIAENDYYILDTAADSGKATLSAVTGANITTKSIALTETDATVNQGETQISLPAILDSGDFAGTDDIVTVLKGAGVLDDAGFDGKLHWNAGDQCFYEAETAKGKNITGTLYMEDPDHAGAYIQVETLTGFETGKTYYLDLDVKELKGPTAGSNNEYLINSITAKGEEPLKAGNNYPLSAYVKLDVVTSGGGVASDYVVTYKAGDHGKLDGAATERVKRGAYPTAVPTVTANEGYTFLGWSLDGKTVVDPTTVKITKRTTFTALYSEKGQKHTAYVEGVGEGLFAPMGEMTRAEAATMLARLSPDFKADGSYATGFPDLDSGEWYYNAVAFAAENGIVEGMEDGTFRPMQKITRAEFAAMLVRYMGIDPVMGESKYPDVPGGDYWATGYINALAEAGIVDGTDEGLFLPLNNLSRAEAVKMINGAIGRTPSQSAMEANAASITNPFSDVDSDYWAYYHILEAAVEHEIPLFHGQQ